MQHHRLSINLGARSHKFLRPQMFCGWCAWLLPDYALHPGKRIISPGCLGCNLYSSNEFDGGGRFGIGHLHKTGHTPPWIRPWTQKRYLRELNRVLWNAPGHRWSRHKIQSFYIWSRVYFHSVAHLTIWSMCLSWINRSVLMIFPSLINFAPVIMSACFPWIRYKGENYLLFEPLLSWLNPI